eukprot:m.128480 g.128480  ORF g.128480 m.128480 type:complete len:468 (-) comp14731_c0_seq4:46-1449(-)
MSGAYRGISPRVLCNSQETREKCSEAAARLYFPSLMGAPVHGEGSSALEIDLLLASLCASVCFAQTLKSYGFLLESLFLLAIPLLNILSLSLSFFFLACVVAALFLLWPFVRAESNTSAEHNTPARRRLPRHPAVPAAISVYRVLLMIATSICILAVDFPSVFPLRLAKTSHVGVSLMDLGAGSMALSAGLATSQDGARRRWRGLGLLGVLRWGVLAAIRYAVPVDEYGQHWNFFITLSLLHLVHYLSPRLPPSHHIWWLLGGALTHEFILAHGGGYDWIAGPRGPGLIEANKEGLVSLPGYLVLYSTGRCIAPLFYRSSISDTKLLSSTRIAGILTALGLVSRLILFAVCHTIPPSRRVANLTYILHVGGTNALLLAACTWLTARIPSPTPTSRRVSLFEAFSKHQLAMFLLANVLTGAFNVSLPHLHLSPSSLPTAPSLAVLTLYLVLLAGGCLLIHFRTLRSLV